MTLNKIKAMPKQKYVNPNKNSNNRYSPIADYLKSKDFHRNRLWRLRDGIFYTFDSGKWVTAEEFEAKYKPVNPICLTFSQENPDGTGLYLK